MAYDTSAHRIPKLGILAFAGLALGLAGAGWLYYSLERASLGREAQRTLRAVADLKAGEIALWSRERRSDAEALMHNPLLAAEVCRGVADPTDTALRRTTGDWLEQLRMYGDCRAVFLLDAELSTRLQTGEGEVVGVDGENLALQALETQRVVSSGLQPGPHPGTQIMDMLVPLTARLGSPHGEVRCILLMRIDAHPFLGPLLKSWPTSSPSAESLMVRREGNELVFLNPVRLPASGESILRLPLVRDDQPSVAAACGREGVMQGADYRGVEVLAAARHIPGTAWQLVCKMDSRDVFAPLSARAAATGLAIGLLIFLAGAGLVISWMRREGVWGSMHAEFSRRAALKTRAGDMLAISQIALQNAPVGIVAYRERGSCVYANPAAARILDTTPDALLAQDFRHSPSWKAGGMLDAAEKALAGGAPAHCDARLTVASGKEVRVICHFAPCTIHGYRYLLAVFSDGSALASAQEERERVLVEAARRQGEGLGHTLLDALGQAAFIMDTEGVLLHVNDQMVQVCGKPESELLGRSAYELTQAPILSSRRRQVQMAIERGRAVRFTEQWGTRRIECSVHPLLEEGGTVRRLVIIGWDISEDQRTKRAAREARSMLQQIVDSLPQQVFWKDRALKYLGCNRAFAGKAGLLDPREIAGRDDFGLRWKSKAVQRRIEDNKVMESDTPVVDKVRSARNADGSTTQIRGSRYPLHDASGAVVGVIGIEEELKEDAPAQS